MDTLNVWSLCMLGRTEMFGCISTDVQAVCVVCEYVCIKSFTSVQMIMSESLQFAYIETYV